MAECPHCSKPGEEHALFWDGMDENGRRVGGSGMGGCRTCGGTHEITQEHADRILLGSRMRAQRLDRRLPLGEAATLLGLQPSELSGIECGREPVTDRGREVAAMERLRGGPD